MNKHITTALTLIAISVPVFAGAQTAPAGAAPAKATPGSKANPIVAPMPVAPKGLPEKIIKERVGNVINTLTRHQELLSVAINKVTEQSTKFKSMGGDVSKADVDITAAREKLDEVKKDIANLQDILKTRSVTDKTNTQAIRDGVTKTTNDLRACRTAIVEGIQKLKAVKVTRPATPTPAPKAATTPKP
jgi:peptidoglycan hydrolase CwlO-like protein